MRYLPWTASKTRLREAENARKNRLEIVRALSHGQVSRRDLLKLGLFTTAGLLAPIGGLNPFVGSASSVSGSSIPTGAPPSPLFGVQPFTQPMPRFNVPPRNPVTSLNPFPTAQSNQTQRAVDPALGGGFGPIEGRPPGAVWAHQRFKAFPPAVAVEASQLGARVNTGYNPTVPSSRNSGIDPTAPFRPRFHPDLPDQGPLSLWTFNGTLPPNLVIGRYGEPILFRHHNELPVDVTQNGGFGRHTRHVERYRGHCLGLSRLQDTASAAGSKWLRPYTQTGRRSAPRGCTDCQPFVSRQLKFWLRGRDLNPRPLGYEPNELPDCSTPRHRADLTV